MEEKFNKNDKGDISEDAQEVNNIQVVSSGEGNDGQKREDKQTTLGTIS